MGNIYGVIFNHRSGLLLLVNIHAIVSPFFFPEMKDERYVYFIALIHHVEKKERNPAIFRYFLAVSGNRWEKNNLRAVMAFDRLVTDEFATGCKNDSHGYKEIIFLNIE